MTAAISFTVRAATASDLACVEALFAASYPELMRHAYAPATLSAALPYMIRAKPGLVASGRFYIASTISGSVVSCGGWSVGAPDGSDPQSAHLRHFATHPAHIRQGLGRAIGSRCAADAKAAGVSELACFSSLNAEPFYSALGFVRDRTMQVMIGGEVPLPVIFMRMRILP